MKKLMILAAMVAAFGIGGAAAFAASAEKPPSPPGQGDCEHGNTQKQCKDDSQPEHGKDCEEHGNSGGVNEDHCKNETTPTETTPTETTPTETTPTETTPTETTPTDTGHTNTTQTETTSTEPSSTESTATETTATDTTSAEEEGADVFAPPTKKKPAGRVVVAAVSAPAAQPTKAPQAAPFTP
jgi:hypothetical protein